MFARRILRSGGMALHPTGRAVHPSCPFAGRREARYIEDMASILTDTIRIAVSQQDSLVGDIQGNLKRARAARAVAAAGKADLVVLSELFIAGYPPEDLVLKPAFQDACRKAVEELAA